MLDRLYIQGIRSFSPKHGENIEFYTPLTLIVGKNGSGKTTIIECLRYATTGDMPPNTKGGAFVHDPKLYGEDEVKASVKLRYSNSDGQKFGSTRVLSLTRKKTKYELKTLENTVSVKAKGEEDYKTATARCVNADDFVSDTLGVSPAILSNVIFCHQEDSNW